MNILYLCDEYPPGPHGGIGTAVQLLAREVVKQGHRVVVAGLYSPGFGGANEFDDEGVKVYRFRWAMDKKWFANSKWLAARIIWRILKETGAIQNDIEYSLAAYHKNLKKIIADNQIDLVEMPDYNDYMRFCTSSVQFPELPVPVVVKMHGSITYTRGGPDNVAGHIVEMEQAILQQASAVTAVSKYVAGKTAAYLAYHGQIQVIYNGIKTDLPRQHDSRNTKQVIYTGKLVQGKGVYQLAKAWNIVNKTMPVARLLLLGTGPQDKVISNLASDARNTVTFLGHVPKEQVYLHLSGSAVSVFPSYSEAFALAPLEAMACGTAVINPNRTSGPELIADKIDGLLIDPDNIDQIASAILYLLNNAGMCAQIAANGNKKVKEHFEITKIAQQNICLYESVCKQEK